MPEKIVFYLDPEKIEEQSDIALIQIGAVLDMASAADVPARAVVIEEIQRVACWCCDFLVEQYGFTEQQFDEACSRREDVANRGRESNPIGGTSDP